MDSRAWYAPAVRLGFSVVLVAWVFVGLAGCGGGGSSVGRLPQSSGNTGGDMRITINVPAPAARSVAPGGARASVGSQLRVHVQTGGVDVVRPQVVPEPDPGGSVTVDFSNVPYTATTILVEVLDALGAVQSTQSFAFTWQAVVTVTLQSTGPVDPIVISPANGSVVAGGPLAFTASGGSGSGYAWSLSTNNSGGTIDASTGAYTAGATGNVSDVVRVTDNQGNTATASVRVRFPTGTVTEFSVGITANSSPSAITAGPDGNLWFTEPTGDRIGRITPTGTVTEFSVGITAGSSPWGIAAGPDGNLWFTEVSSNRIGRITPTGTVTEFSAGITGGCTPAGITAGPDGNLWFTEFNGNRIGRITPTGTVTEFSAGITAGSGPYDITAGPDGNLWFTENNGHRIGRITPTGTVTEFSVGVTAGSGPLGITAGPDGNLWFTENSGNRIGRITPTGTVTEFSVGITAGSGLFGITSGPDGNLWFTESNGHRIGRITPTGTVTEFSVGITPNSRPLFITAGPDGNLWFTENVGNRIGRITP